MSKSLSGEKDSGRRADMGVIEKTGKVFSWTTLLQDHTRFALMLPRYLGAYVAPGQALKPTTIEAVMCTMNTVNTCPSALLGGAFCFQSVFIT